MKRIVTTLSAFLILSAAAFAGDATGKWKGSFEVPGGPVVNITFDLKASGAALSGKVLGLPPSENGIEIKDGKVDGDSLSFWLMTEYQGSPIKIVYTGKVGDGQIKFVMGTEDGGWSTEILAKPVS